MTPEVSTGQFQLCILSPPLLNGMHAKSCEGLDVSVAVVDRVDVFVQRSDVDEPSCLRSNPSYRYPKGWSYG